MKGKATFGVFSANGVEDALGLATRADVRFDLTCRIKAQVALRTSRVECRVWGGDLERWELRSRRHSLVVLVRDVFLQHSEGSIIAFFAGNVLRSHAIPILGKSVREAISTDALTS